MNTESINKNNTDEIDMVVLYDALGNPIYINK